MKQKTYQAKIKQGGILVVSVECIDKEQAEREIQHYALMYSQDGQVEIIRNYRKEKTQ